MSEYSESFELWAQKNGYAMQRAGAISSYVAPLTQCAWLAWKAGSAAAQARISELEAQVSAWQRWYDHWEFSNDYNLPDSPETEDQMK